MHTKAALHVSSTANARRTIVLSTMFGAALFVAACSGDQVVAGGPYKDIAKPRITLVKGNSTADSLLPITVSAHDDIGIKNIHVMLAGGVVATYDTTLTSASTALDFGVLFLVPKSAPLGATVNVRAVVTDGALSLRS